MAGRSRPTIPWIAASFWPTDDLPKNPFFAKAIVNRMWRNFMGRGMVEPVDDFRLTNPATNEPLLEALAKDFIAHGYDSASSDRNIAARGRISFPESDEIQSR